MKMYIKLTQAETEGWNAVKNAITAGQDISDDNLAKLLFFRGLNNIMDELKQDFGVLGDELMGSQIITQVAPQDLILPK